MGVEEKKRGLGEKSAKVSYIGGQAVMEGVMMRGKKSYAMAVRKPDNEIEMIKKNLKPTDKRAMFLKLPLVRGIVSFVDSMVMGVGLTMKSSEIAIGDALEEENPGKFEKFLTDKLGDKLFDVLMGISLVMSLGLALILFTFLPVWVTGWLKPLTVGRPWLISLIEGVLKIGIFVAYLLLVSRSKDIRRVFQYHGAEHKTINCHEHNEALTVENVRKYSRFHKRCGTSFLIIVMIISIVMFIFVKSDIVWVRFGLKVLFIPLIAGISYEFIRLAGRSDSLLVRAVSFPGICMQRITTSEPDDSQIEVAIAAMKEVLANES